MMLKYKDYLGSAEMDLESNTLHGKLLFIRDLVTYEADSPAELQAAFEAAVIEYLADCKEYGRNPEKPCKGQFNVRISPDMHREIAVAALEGGKSMNEYVSLVLSCHKNLMGAEQHHKAAREALFVSAKLVMAQNGVKQEFSTIPSNRNSAGDSFRLMEGNQSKWADNTSKAH
ncbi:putative HicB family RNase H-like nuclease [Yoonia maricola]|uniref:Putative HicB family RNase H-like nuclease n=1 Tax=Yoonia maricola TaxID=420999 RepID=A0A2M8WJU8_9RHOB|nr:type II toxin-antitoxin system HicB family antitoxin [Yoonia maricola]PJI91197.1 putative HicB family RNase H-like nuclease [Yoonia maricola]